MCIYRWELRVSVDLLTALTLLPGGGVLYVAVEQLGVLKYDVFTGAALGTVPCNDCIGLTYDK